MDFMEMREALGVAGCLAANGNQECFYGARPGAASRAMSGTAYAETISRHAAATSRIRYDPRTAPGIERKPS